MIRVCEYCGDEYKNSRRRSLYCSRECASIARRKHDWQAQLTCIICGNQFRMGEGENWVRKTCGDACMKKYRFNIQSEYQAKLQRTRKRPLPKSGVRGVTKEAGKGRLKRPYRAFINDHNRKQVYKNFTTFEEAVAQRRAWEKEYGYERHEHETGK